MVPVIYPTVTHNLTSETLPYGVLTVLRKAAIVHGKRV
jgi:hypothetical protein